MKEKRALMVATVPSMIGQFNTSNLQTLKDLGYQVDVAADFKDSSIWPSERVQKFRDEMASMNIECIQLNFSRRPLNIGRHIQSYKETLALLSEREYSLIHTHTPIASAIVRIAARKTSTKVIYTAHGFHFFDGAPLKNWMLFYPLEKWLSRYTDVLITINQEDYQRAKQKFKAKKTIYVPGVGIDIKKFATRPSGRKRIREELGIDRDRILVLSVGDLNESKSHEVVIRALRGIEGITYVVAGKGRLTERLRDTAKENKVDLRLLGNRTDVADFFDAADVYVLPGIGEGFNASLMEAMASGCSCCCGRICGNTDLIGDDSCLFDPFNVSEIRSAVEYAIKNKEQLGKRNREKIKAFDLRTAQDIVREMHQERYEHLIQLLRRQQKRAEIGVPIDCNLMISVGELSARKNHGIIVEALQNLPDEYWYVIVGKGDRRDELENVDHTGKLKLVGFRTDIVDLLHASDLFVFPSLQEGLPVALMEALAAGMKCVASDIRGNSDLMDKGLVKGMNLRDWENEILKGGSRADMAFFGKDAVQQKMLEVYQSVQ